MDDDLLEQLRTRHIKLGYELPTESLFSAAADELERLNAENARLREAMEEYVNTVVKMEGVTFVDQMENAELRAVVKSVLAEKEKRR